MAVIEIDELTKVYKTGMKKGDIVALDCVSLDIQAGEIFGLLGPNGAGKTTLFKVLLSITAISAGRARINGLAPENPRSRAGLGYLPESHRFPGYLTGLGFLNSAGRLHGMNQTEISTRTESLLRLVGMERWSDSKLKTYSKGMLQRIGIAQAMISDPDILLLDEPTDGVDPIGRVEIRKMMENLRGEGKTIVLNSHLLSEVESVADRVAILQKGRIARIGTVESLTTRKCRYEIDAEIGNRLVKIPKEIGQIVSLSTNHAVVQLEKEENINFVIDELRRLRIKIVAVRPEKVTLEQSFMETVAADAGESE